jgi:uncharacterized protein YecE (DUF72 family)
MAKIIVGTSGYSYKDWVGPFYPAGTKEAEFLSYYEKQFGYVELNFSYYAMPSPMAIDSMAKKTGEDFLFGIKAHKSLTHEIDPTASEAQATEFRKGVAPLVERGKLAVILFQFPYSYHYTDDNRRFLDKICTWFSGYPIAVEFRNTEWLKDSVIDALKERNAAIVNVDEPALPKLLPSTENVTSELAYIRFHGRNKKDWWEGTNVTRYDYLYTDSEMEEWVPRIERMLTLAKILIVAFNNHFNAQAVKNAGRLREILAERKMGEVM